MRSVASPDGSISPNLAPPQHCRLSMLKNTKFWPMFFEGLDAKTRKRWWKKLEKIEVGHYDRDRVS